MHVRTKNMATGGLLVAFSVIMMILSSAIESSSLFFIAAASFCVGIAVREWGLRWGGVFFLASVCLNLILAPSKLYCFMLAGMGAYIWFSEWLWNKVANANKIRHRLVVLWIGKYVFFNLLYIPVLFGAPHILFTGKINGLAAVLFLILGQAVFFVYDMAYRYFQEQVWGRLRGKLFPR